jgi:hypothetical protein
MIVTARMGMKRAVIGLTDAPCRFQQANDTPPPDARNVSESRKSAEVPSLAQDPLGAVDSTSSRRERQITN